jgi:hypothetical protein
VGDDALEERIDVHRNSQPGVQFRRTGPWPVVPDDRVGVQSILSRLAVAGVGLPLEQVFEPRA